MKAILEFDLNDPDDRLEHLRCVNANDMAFALFQILNNAHRHVECVEDYQKNILEAVGTLDIDRLVQ